MDKINVFVTYSWGNPDHQQKVISFVNHLRENGFNAVMDKKLSQEETSLDFKVMMHKSINEYNKVIVILSEGYKIKADKFIGGIGEEYNLILKDIEKNKKKYILVSFEGYREEIFPLFFKSRDTVDLSKMENMNVLFSKLLDENIYDFSNINDSIPNVPKSFITKFIKDIDSTANTLDTVLDTIVSEAQNTSWTNEIQKSDINPNDTLWEVYKKSLGGNPTDTWDFGIFSVALIMELSKTFDVSIPDEDLDRLTENYTIKQWVSYINILLSKKNRNERVDNIIYPGEGLGDISFGDETDKVISIFGTNYQINTTWATAKKIGNEYVPIQTRENQRVHYRYEQNGLKFTFKYINNTLKLIHITINQPSEYQTSIGDIKIGDKFKKTTSFFGVPFFTMSVGVLYHTSIEGLINGAYHKHGIEFSILNKKGLEPYLEYCADEEIIQISIFSYE